MTYASKTLAHDPAHWSIGKTMKTFISIVAAALYVEDITQKRPSLLLGTFTFLMMIRIKICSEKVLNCITTSPSPFPSLFTTILITCNVKVMVLNLALVGCKEDYL